MIKDKFMIKIIAPISLLFLSISFNFTQSNIYNFKIVDFQRKEYSKLSIFFADKKVGKIIALNVSKDGLTLYGKMKFNNFKVKSTMVFCIARTLLADPVVKITPFKGDSKDLNMVNDTIIVHECRVQKDF